MQAPSDAPIETEAFLRWLAGDDAAFRLFFERAAPVVLAIARRAGLGDADARDVVQQTFLGVHRARADFRPGAPVRPWLVSIARNVVRDHLRRRSRRREEALELDGRIDPRVEARDYGLSDEERLLVWVRAAIARLPESQRRALELHVLEGLPFAEVARSLGCTEGAARVRAHRGYETLRDWLLDPERVGLPVP
ncbi:MAG: sigma-70 family RNA polymerase sigma factor [Sandaracinaceae bacterium]